MRGGIVAVGIVLIGLSIGWYLVGFVSPTIACGLCIVSPVLFVVGVLLFIVGLIAGEPRTTTVVHVQAPTQPTQVSNPCSTCGYPLTWIPKHQRNYCYRCKKYR